MSCRWADLGCAFWSNNYSISQYYPRIGYDYCYVQRRGYVVKSSHRLLRTGKKRTDIKKGLFHHRNKPFSQNKGGVTSLSNLYRSDRLKVLKMLEVLTVYNGFATLYKSTPFSHRGDQECLLKKDNRSLKVLMSRWISVLTRPKTG